MIFDDNKARLMYAARKLWLHWEQTQADWNDQVARDFQRDHLDDFNPQLSAAVKAIERLAEVVTRAEHECR